MHKLKNVSPGRAEVWDGKKLGTVLRLGTDSQGHDWYSYNSEGELITTLAAESRAKAVNQVLVANGYINPFPPETVLRSHYR